MSEAKITVNAGGLGGKELEEVVDKDIAKFDEYFQRTLKNDPLVGSERAILKTYLHWKSVASK